MKLNKRLFHKMYKSTSGMSHSFFGNFIYDHIIPAHHPLRLLKQTASFEELDTELAHLYHHTKGEGGQKAYKPSLIVRILILQYLYNLSDDKIMNLVKYDLPAKYYVGLAVDEDVPHPTTLTYFRKRLGDEYCKRIFEKTVRIAAQSGLELGNVLLVDATHSNAKVRKEVNESTTISETHKDEDARGGCKGNNESGTPYERGKKGSRKKPFYGYKHHWACENNHNIITGVVVTPGHVHDSKGLVPTLEATDEVIGLQQFAVVGADKAYDDEALHFHELLTGNEIASAISLRKTRLQSRNNETKVMDYHAWPDEGYDNVYYELYLQEAYRYGQGERYKIEQNFGEAKRWHGMGKSRYLGLAKNKIQSYFTAAAINLKHILQGLSPQPIKLYKMLY